MAAVACSGRGCRIGAVVVTLKRPAIHWWCLSPGPQLSLQR